MLESARAAIGFVVIHFFAAGCVSEAVDAAPRAKADAASVELGAAWMEVEAIDPSDSNGQYFMHADGRVFRASVSEAAELTAVEWNGSEDEETVDETGELVGSASAELIFGSDSRVPQFDTTALTSAPLRRIGLIRGTDPDSGGGVFATGSMIGPRHVLTSAHFVLGESGSLMSASSIRFQPGRRGPGFGTRDPNGEARVVVGYYYRPDTDETDYALLILEDRPETAALGWFGGYYASSDSYYEGRAIHMYGYPGGVCWNHPLHSGVPFPCDGFMYRSACTVDDNDNDLEFECDTYGGMSGSLILTYHNSQLRFIGVLKGWESNLFDDWNKAVRLRASIWTDLCNWREAHPSAYASFSCSGT